jgi:hypothetical protein
MKTIVLTLFTVFLVVLTLKTNAQVTSAKSNPKSVSVKADLSHNPGTYISNTGTSSSYSKSQLKGVEGDVFIGKDWPAGMISLRNGGVIDNYKLRYNLLSDQMQFISGKDTLAFAAPEELNTISFSDHTFVFENYSCENVVRQGYFELIVPGKNQLLLKRMVTYEIPDVNSPEDESSTKYLIDECYFMSKPGKPASKMMCNRKSALAVLNEHNDEIEEYMRITGNKVRNSEDLKKLVIYYNSIDE